MSTTVFWSCAQEFTEVAVHVSEGALTAPLDAVQAAAFSAQGVCSSPDLQAGVGFPAPCTGLHQNTSLQPLGVSLFNLVT